MAATKKVKRSDFLDQPKFINMNVLSIAHGEKLPGHRPQGHISQATDYRSYILLAILEVLQKVVMVQTI